MTFERTRDWALVKSIVTHPKIYPHVSDDFAATAGDWQATENESIWYVLVKDTQKIVHDAPELLGLFIFIPHNEICWYVHTCLLPESYGEQSHRAAREVIQWIWNNTHCLRIVTEVPEYNRLALAFAKSAGLICYGVNLKSYMKRQKLYDLIQLGISKPEAQCQ